MFVLALSFLLLPVFILIFGFFHVVFAIIAGVALTLLVWYMHEDGIRVKVSLDRFAIVKLCQLMLICLVVITPIVLFPLNLSDVIKNFAVLNLLTVTDS